MSISHHLLFASFLFAACADTEDAPPLTADERTAIRDQAHQSMPAGMTPEERRAHGQAMFDAADTDHDGKLQRAELEAVPGPGQMLAPHFDELDTDGDGGLTHDEIMTGMHP